MDSLNVQFGPPRHRGYQCNPFDDNCNGIPDCTPWVPNSCPCEALRPVGSSTRATLGNRD